jgi:MFS family permease
MGERSSRRNSTLGILNGMLVNVGNAFVDPFTVLPVFITTFGGSTVLVGFVSATFFAGWFLPQVFVANVAQARRRVLPIYTASAAFRFVGFAGAGASVFLIDPVHRSLILFCVCAGLSLNALAAGVAAVPFLEITSKTVPVHKRGAFFAGRRVVGGILGIAAGLVIAAVLGGDPGAMWARSNVYRAVTSVVDAIGWAGYEFPHDYGLLIIIGAVISTAGVVAYLFVDEPDAKHVARAMPLRAYMAEGFRMLRRAPHYQTFFWMRVYYQLSSMAFPFYATYAYTHLGFSQASVGVFVSIWVGAGVLSNAVWGRLLDRSGNRIVFVSTAAMSVIAPITMLVLAWGAMPDAGVVEAGIFALVGSTFLLNGFVRSGRFIANQTYLLESAPPERRPFYVGFMNSLSFPFMLSPILGGLVVATLGYRTLFAVGGLAAVANIVASARLKEPRRRVVGSGEESLEV